MYAIGYDIGSSSVKAAVVDLETGKSLAVVQEPQHEMPITSRQSGWAEQDPDMWWEHVCTATQRLLKLTGIEAENIQHIGLAYQMHGLVAVDTDGKPVRDAIIWCDSRAVKTGEQALVSLGEDRCREHLLNSPANFTASKLRWVRENEPETFGRIYKFMLPGDYIAFKFSGEIQTSVSGLSEGILWDFKSNDPAKFLMDHYELPTSLIPEVVPTFSESAEVSAIGARTSGLKEGTKISYRAGDQPNNALSLDVMNPGETAATGGTSGVVYAVTDNIKVKELTRVNSFAHVNYTPDTPVIGKLLNINGAGISYKWLRTILGAADYGEMNLLAEEVRPGSEGVRVYPFGNGAERMFGNRIVHAGIERINYNIHSKEHLVRATLEGIAFAFTYGIDILRNDGAQIEVLKTGNDNLFRSPVFARSVANATNTPVVVFNTTGAVGAARACMITAGNRDRFSACISGNDHVITYEPDTEKEACVEAYEDWNKRLNNILKTDEYEF